MKTKRSELPVYSSFALLLAALFCSIAPVRADERSSELLGRLAGAIRALGAYSVQFEVAAGEQRYAGHYDVSGDAYYMTVNGAEVYSDGQTRYEVSPERREVVIDAVDTSSRNLLNNPTRAFDFLGDAFRSELLPSEGEVRRLRLTPVDKGAAMSSITVDVAADGSPRAVIYDLDGERMRIEIRRIEPSAEVRRFDAADYAGYELIDFR